MHRGSQSTILMNSFLGIPCLYVFNPSEFLRYAMKEVFSSDVCYLAATDEGERDLLTIFGKTFQSVDNVCGGQFDDKGL